ncbi:MAG: glycosyltransferase family 2 protein [Chloroflexi bacterium]|nr:glycosyltransferase family 2 protein [Chloroflexota bacterium]
MMSIVVPVYRNAPNVDALVDALVDLDHDLGGIEAVFVVDGSPDDSYRLLRDRLAASGLDAQLILLARNFGAFPAIHAGLAAGRGETFAVMAADLQEPPELLRSFHRLLSTGACDVVVGRRTGRDDPWTGRLLGSAFWSLYRRFVQREVPPGGVDVFALNRRVRDQIVELRESNSSLVGLLFWVGFRRAEVPYRRSVRATGKSAWTLGRRIAYLMDSVFSFSDLPIKLLFRIGVLGLVFSLGFGALVVIGRLFGAIPVPGYAATVLVVAFFGALNCFGLGIIGGYVWRAFENTKGRPNYIVANHVTFSGGAAADGPEHG